METIKLALKFKTMIREVLEWLYAVFHSCFRFRFFRSDNSGGLYSTLEDEDSDEMNTSSVYIYPETKKLLKNIENWYGTNHPTLYTGGDFKSATDRAKREYKLLIVYLHSRDHQDTPEFCR